MRSFWSSFVLCFTTLTNKFCDNYGFFKIPEELKLYYFKQTKQKFNVREFSGASKEQSFRFSILTFVLYSFHFWQEGNGNRTQALECGDPRKEEKD